MTKEEIFRSKENWKNFKQKYSFEDLLTKGYSLSKINEYLQNVDNDNAWELSDNRRTFEVVEKVPENYIVWNIGYNMENEYLVPFAEPVDEFSINPQNLKAVALSVKAAELLKKAASAGVVNIQKTDEEIEKILNNEFSWFMDYEKGSLADLVEIREIFEILTK